jgi:hypothetical protein
VSHEATRKPKGLRLGQGSLEHKSGRWLTNGRRAFLGVDSALPALYSKFVNKYTICSFTSPTTSFSCSALQTSYNDFNDGHLLSICCHFSNSNYSLTYAVNYDCFWSSMTIPLAPPVHSVYPALWHCLSPDAFRPTDLISIQSL